MRLKDSNGNVVEVKDCSCYSPNERGEVVAAMGGFSYFVGKPTDDPVNCVRDDGNGSLAQRGGLRRIAAQKSMEGDLQQHTTAATRH